MTKPTKKPPTILYPGTFDRSPSANFDGVFDWSWTQGCFDEEGKITPMDFDFVLERRGQFLVMESKAPGVAVPDGQLYALEAAWRLGHFTIMLVWGKSHPETAECWFPDRRPKEALKGVEECRAFVKRWYKWADGWGRL